MSRNNVPVHIALRIEIRSNSFLKAPLCGAFKKELGSFEHLGDFSERIVPLASATLSQLVVACPERSRRTKA